MPKEKVDDINFWKKSKFPLQRNKLLDKGSCTLYRIHLYLIRPSIQSMLIVITESLLNELGNRQRKSTLPLKSYNWQGSNSKNLHQLTQRRLSNNWSLTG